MSRLSTFDSMQPVKGNRKKKSRENGMPKLSMAAAKYAAALLNPWCPLASGSYIPVGNGRASQKTSAFNRFDLTIGTNGVGWAVFAPVVSSNNPCAWVTDAAYTGVSAIPYAVAFTNTLNVGVRAVTMPTGYSNVNLALAYNPGSATQTLALLGRVVSFGITASYTGTTLNEGGLMYCFADPGHLSVVGSTAATLGYHAECEVTNVSRQKCYLVDHPLIESETAFDRTTDYEAAASLVSGATAGIVINYPFASGLACVPDSAGAVNFPDVATRPGQPTSIIYVTGTPGNTIHIEIVAHLEYQGNSCEGRTTPSPVDRVGYDMVNAGVSAASLGRNSVQGRSIADAFLEGVKANAIALAPTTSSIVASAIGL